MLSLRDLLQLTRRQRIFITVVLSIAAIFCLAGLAIFLVKDSDNPIAPLLTALAQVTWSALIGWAVLLMISQGETPARISSLTDEFLTEIFPNSLSAIQYFMDRHEENKLIASDGLFKLSSNGSDLLVACRIAVHHSPRSPFAYYKLHLTRGTSYDHQMRIWLFVNQTTATVMYFFRARNVDFESNTRLREILEDFGKTEQDFGYASSYEFNPISSEGVNLHKLLLFKKLPDGFINSGREKLSFSQDVLMMTKALMNLIEDDRRLHTELTKLKF